MTTLSEEAEARLAEHQAESDILRFYQLMRDAARHERAGLQNAVSHHVRAVQAWGEARTLEGSLPDDEGTEWAERRAELTEYGEAQRATYVSAYEMGFLSLDDISDLLDLMYDMDELTDEEYAALTNGEGE